MVAINYRYTDVTDSTSTTDTAYNDSATYTVTSTGSCYIDIEYKEVIDWSKLGWYKRKIEIKPFILRNCIQLRGVNYDGRGWA